MLVLEINIGSSKIVSSSLACNCRAWGHINILKHGSHASEQKKNKIKDFPRPKLPFFSHQSCQLSAKSPLNPLPADKSNKNCIMSSAQISRP